MLFKRYLKYVLVVMMLSVSVAYAQSTSRASQTQGTPNKRVMATGMNGWQVDELYTIGEVISGTTGVYNPTSAGTYTPPGILDGLGAYELDADTVRVFANHELANNLGYDYEVSDGMGGTFTLDGARVSYFDIDKASRQIIDAGLAYNTIYNALGEIATDASFVTNDGLGFGRFCSSKLVEAHQFGAGYGLENRIYFAGEEDGGSVGHPVGGGEWALDPATGNFWHVADMGRGAWENITELNTGTTTHVAILLSDDTVPFDADGDTEHEAAPVYLYVGEKDANGDFLAQNGLRGGTLYVWVSDTNETTPLEFNTSGSLVGRWMALDMSLGTPSEDGSSGYDEYGYPTQSTLWTQAEALGAFGFSRPEDVATNPSNGTQAVLASTGVDTYAVDSESGNGADTFGTLYTIETDFSDMENLTAVVTILYDGDADPTRALRSPDNLDWADDGYIYVQEDKAETDTLSGDEILFGDGAVNPHEAGIVQLNPMTMEIVRLANIDRTILLDPTVNPETSAVDLDAGTVASWETSGILDVSTFFGEAGGTLFLFNIQAHGLDDQDTVNPSSRLNDDDLVEGGQMVWLTSDITMMDGVGDWETAVLFTVGETISDTTGAYNMTTSGSYTPPGILDGLGAYELDADTVRVFANHELRSTFGYDYEVSDGMGGTFTLDGARISYFDIDKTSRQIIDAGLAYNTIYNALGAIATDASFLTNDGLGFGRFCSSQLAEAHQFGAGYGLENRIYFAGEEDGSLFHPVGGGEWALDPATGNLWHVSDMGRGAWENVAELNTGTTTHVAILLADDSAPFDADGDTEEEAAPMYLYVGEKDANGDFLAQNGLRGGTLYVWVSDTNETTPLEFNTSGSLVGSWVALDMSLGTPSEDGATGYDEYGYPTQRTLWTQAEALGAFGFSRPEDVATNPHDGTQAVIASTGVDTYAVDSESGNGADTFGTLYTIETDFSDMENLTAVVTILYDGDADPTRALRSPDNLDWADNGYIYVQEDKAEVDTLSGDEILFGDGAVNPNEAGIVQLDPLTGETLRIANVDRDTVLDPTLPNPMDAVDMDAGIVGSWESSGILDVSTLFNEEVGTLFLFNLEAHGIDDQETINPSSRINDDDLVEGGQLMWLMDQTYTVYLPFVTTP